MDRCILVNNNNPINKKIIDKIDFVETTNIDSENVKVEKDAYNHFLLLKEFCKNIGIDIDIESAYRSFDEQQETIDYYLEKKGQDYCDKFVAPVGCSEHHTGLAIDFYIKDENYPIDDVEIINDEKYREVHKHLKDFGFILRYPKGKEDITGYSYEAWHIRYVGEVVASICFDNNWTLEEYKDNFSGVIVVNKEKGITSHDVVDRLRNIFGIKKIGHTGTLDPLAEGVLIVCIGEATKIVELLTSYDKEYVAGVKLGIKTDTYDIEGQVIDTKEVSDCLKIEEVLNSFKKTYFQEVPIYSAIKVNGKKLYEYARNNEKVDLPKKEVTVKEIELLDSNKDSFTFRAIVTKGCYIRSLINDIGNELDTYATMSSLIRTKQGNVSIEDSYTISDIENNNFKLYKIEEILDYPVINVNNELEKLISNGVKIDNKWNVIDKVIFKNDSKLLGIYEIDNNKLKVWKNFK